MDLKLARIVEQDLDCDCLPPYWWCDHESSHQVEMLVFDEGYGWETVDLFRESAIALVRRQLEKPLVK